MGPAAGTAQAAKPAPQPSTSKWLRSSLWLSCAGSLFCKALLILVKLEQMLGSESQPQAARELVAAAQRRCICQTHADGATQAGDVLVAIQSGRPRPSGPDPAEAPWGMQGVALHLAPHEARLLSSQGLEASAERRCVCARSVVKGVRANEAAMPFDLIVSFRDRRLGLMLATARAHPQH